MTAEVRTGSYAFSSGYTYDHNANRLSRTQNGATDTYVYDAHDKLLSAGSKTYAYDLNGNVKTITTGGQTSTLTWDDENRLTALALAGGPTDTFAYTE